MVNFRLQMKSFCHTFAQLVTPGSTCPLYEARQIQISTALRPDWARFKFHIREMTIKADECMKVSTISKFSEPDFTKLIGSR